MPMNGVTAAKRWRACSVIIPLALGPACTNQVWIDFPPGLETGSAIGAYFSADGLHPFALPADSAGLRLPTELPTDSDLHIEAVVYDRSLAAIGIVEGPLRIPAADEPAGPLPPWSAAYRIAVRGGRADGDGHAWTSLAELSDSLAALRLPYGCAEGPRPDARELPEFQDVGGSVLAGEWAYYVIETRSADSRLTVWLHSMPQDLDLYVSQEGLPTQCSASCRSESTGEIPETCEIPEPGDARWFIGVRGVQAGPFILRATRHGTWANCAPVGVAEAGRNTHQTDPPPWCPEGTFLTRITQHARGLGPLDSPVIGSVECCGSSDVGRTSWTECAWHAVEQAGISSFEPTGTWCPQGTYLNQLDLDGGASVGTGPEIGQALCCGLDGGPPSSYHSCAWVPVADSYDPDTSWCPEGSFLTQLALRECDEPYRCPVIAQARCCRPQP